MTIRHWNDNTYILPGLIFHEFWFSKSKVGHKDLHVLDVQMILIHVVITENTFEEHCTNMWLNSFSDKGHELISNLFKPKKQDYINSSGQNVQEHIFKVKMKVDPGAERKSSGNFFCLLVLLSYLLASFSGRLWLRMVLIWH